MLRADALATLGMAPGHGIPLPPVLLDCVSGDAHPYGGGDSDEEAPGYDAEEEQDPQYTRQQLIDMLPPGIEIKPGTRAFGAALGSGEAGRAYIREHLRGRTTRALSITRKLREVGDPWVEFQLLRYVCSARMRYTPRAMPYKGAVGDYAREIDEETDAELARILEHDGPLADSARDQAALPPKDGGLGLPYCADTAPAACIASWSSCLPLLKAHAKAKPAFAGLYQHATRVLATDEHMDPLGVVAAHGRLLQHHRWLNDRANAAVVNPDDPAKAKSPLKLAPTAAGTLTAPKKQSERTLALLVNQRMRSQLLAVPEDGESPYYERPLNNEDRRRIESASGQLAHEFMGMAPRQARVGCSPPAVMGPGFRLCLQFRLGLRLSTNKASGRTCASCGRPGDPYGHHSIGCDGTNARLLRHNAPLQVLLAMAKNAGHQTMIPGRGQCNGQHYATLDDPPEGMAATWTPDALVLDCPQPGRTAVCDVTVWHANRPSNRAEAPRRAVPLETADHAENRKRTHVAEFVAALDAQGTPADQAEVFFPLAVETYGAPSGTTLRMFKWLVEMWKEAKQATPSQVAYYRHQWKFRFSVAVQRHNARMLMDGGAAKADSG